MSDDQDIWQLVRASAGEPTAAPPTEELRTRAVRRRFQRRLAVIALGLAGLLVVAPGLNNLLHSPRVAFVTGPTEDNASATDGRDQGGAYTGAVERFRTSEDQPPPERHHEKLVITAGRGENDLVITAGGYDSASIIARHAGSRERRWSYELRDTAFIQGRREDMLLVASQYEVMAALDVETGVERWRHKFAPTESPGHPALAANTMYLPTEFPLEGDTTAPNVYGVDLSTGAIRWRTSLQRGSDVQWSPPVITQGIVLVADTPSHPGSAKSSWLHALDATTGHLRWRFDLETDRQGFHDEQPLTDAKRVFVASPAGTLYAVDLRTGEEVWRRAGATLPRLIEADGNVVVVEMDGDLLQLDARNGSQR